MQRFFDGIDKYSPDLVSWNGSGFDLPVLTYRALLHGVQAPRYWETGDGETAFRYNNYLSRYHWRHTDLMDVLSGSSSRSRVIACEHGNAARAARQARLRGRQVWDAWRGGNIAGIRALLRDRRAQHLAHLAALRAVARGGSRARSTPRKSSGCRAICARRRATLGEFLRGVGGAGLSAPRFAPANGAGAAGGGGGDRDESHPRG